MARKFPRVSTSREVLAHIDRSRPVHVYRNLHTNAMSVKQGTVKCHTENVVLYNAEFKVGKKGREKVLREKKKNVHAYIKGFVVDPRETDHLLCSIWGKAYYNPYKTDRWIDPQFKGYYILQSEYVDICPKSVLIFNAMYKNETET